MVQQKMLTHENDEKKERYGNKMRFKSGLQVSMVQNMEPRAGIFSSCLRSIFTFYLEKQVANLNFENKL